MSTTRQVLLRLVAAGALCWLALATVGGGAVATPSPHGTDHPGPDRLAQTTPSLALATQTPFVGPRDEWLVELGLSGDTSTASLAFTLYEPIVSGRDGLDAAVSGTRLGRRLRAPLTVPVANLPVSDGTVQARFQIVDDGDNPLVGFRLSTPGVYPVAIELRSASDETLDELVTYLIRLPAAAEAAGSSPEVVTPLGVATLLPFRAPLATGTDGRRSVDPAALAWLRAVGDAVVTHPEVPLSLAPSPETVDALASEDGNGRALIDDLRNGLSDRQVVSSTYVPIDVGAFVEVGLDTAVKDQRAAGAAVLTPALVSDRPLDVRTWIADPTLTTASLDLLRDDGVDQLVLPERMLDPLPDDEVDTLTRPFEVSSAAGARLPALATDARLADRLTATDDPVLNAQLALADLTLIWEEQPDDPGVVVLGVPLGSTSPETIDALLDGLMAATRPVAGAAPTLAPSTLDEAFAVPPATGPGAVPLTRSWAPVAGAGLATYPSSLAAAEISVDGYESMVATTAPDRVVPLRRLLLVSGADGLDPGQRQNYLDAATGTVNDQVAGIQAPEQPVVNLTAREATIPVEVVNALDYPVEVRIVFASEKLQFPDGEIVIARLEPGSNRLEIRVKARASGTFPVEVRLFSPDSGIALPETEVTVRSTAVSGLGLVLSVGAGVFLLVWWGRHLHRTRQNRRLVPHDGSGSQDGATAHAGTRSPDA